MTVKELKEALNALTGFDDAQVLVERACEVRVLNKDDVQTFASTTPSGVVSIDDCTTDEQCDASQTTNDGFCVFGPYVLFTTWS